MIGDGGLEEGQKEKFYQEDVLEFPNNTPMSGSAKDENSIQLFIS